MLGSAVWLQLGPAPGAAWLMAASRFWHQIACGNGEPMSLGSSVWSPAALLLYALHDSAHPPVRRKYDAVKSAYETSRNKQTFVNGQFLS